MSDYEEEDDYVYESAGDDDCDEDTTNTGAGGGKGKAKATGYRSDEYDDDQEEEEYVYESESEGAGGDVYDTNASFASPTLDAMSATSARRGGGRGGRASSASTNGMVAGGKDAEYFVVEKTALLMMEDRDIDKISDLLGVDRPTAHLVLMRYQWNSEEVTNLFLEKGLEHLTQAAGAGQDTTTVTAFECGICGDDACELLKSRCGHSFCSDCWGGHTRVKVSEGKSRRIPCMAYKCTGVCDDTIVRKVLEGELLQKYNDAVRGSFVEDNPRARWCQSVPHCGRAILLSPRVSTRIEVECTCGTMFCFRCSEHAHTPVPCEWYAKWLEKCTNESETANYITSHCKPCPRCKKNIEKADGCNHVKCVCGQAMCWLCGAATGTAHSWTAISGHTCGSFKDELQKNSNDARAELERYMHYFTRYNAHMDSLKAAAALKVAVNATKDALEDASGKSTAITTNMPCTDWLTIGLEQLLRMREILAHSYVFGFYVFKKPQVSAEGDADKAEKDKAKPAAAGSQPPPRKRGKKTIAAGSVMTRDTSIGKAAMALGASGAPEEYVQQIFEEIQARFENSVERLSALVETKAVDITEETKAQVLQFANSTHVNCKALFDVLQTEVLTMGNIPGDIAPYRPIRLMVSGVGASVDDDDVGGGGGSGGGSSYKAPASRSSSSSFSSSGGVGESSKLSVVKAGKRRRTRAQAKK